MKQILSVTLLLALVFSHAYADDLGRAKHRENFFSSISKVFNFSKAEIKIIRAAGYSAHFCMSMLFIAKEAGVPVSELISMRDNEGASFQQMCEKYGLDYEKTMIKLRDEILKNKFSFPPETDSEMKKTISTVPDKKGGK